MKKNCFGLILAIGLGAGSAVSGQNLNPMLKTDVFRQIKYSEYAISWHEEDRAFSSPNREHELRFRYYDNGFSAEPRIPAPEKNWQITLTLDSLGQGNPVPETINKIKYGSHELAVEKAGLTFEYINDERGMRQNFHLLHKPSPGLLRLELKADLHKVALRQDVGENFVYFVNPAGHEVMRYTDLNVWDSKGRILPALMTSSDKRITILVDDTDAVYPVVVDPISIYTGRNGSAAGDKFGFAIANSQTIGGAATSALIVGAPNFDYSGSDKGAVYAFYGSGSGLQSNPNWYAYGTQASGNFGHSVAVGDFNDDGRDDLLVGAPNVSYGSYTGNGVAYCWYANSSNGTLPVPGGGLPALASDAGWSHSGGGNGIQFGFAVANIGIPNSGSVDCAMITAPYWNSASYSEVGAAYVFNGSSSGLGGSAATSHNGDNGYDHFGWSISAGNIDANFYNDVAIGSPGFDNGGTADVGKVKIFLGSSTGLPFAASGSITGSQASSQTGWSVALGDIDGDGDADLAIGSPYYNGSAGTDSGQVAVHHSNGSAISSSSSWTTTGDYAGDRLGWSVSIGKVTSSTYRDLLMGAPYYDTIQTDIGAAFLYEGTSSGIGNYIWGASGNSANGHFGSSVLIGYNLDHANRNELIIGAPESTTGGLNPAWGDVTIYTYTP